MTQAGSPTNGTEETQVDEQLALQRRILETLAVREDELRAIRRQLESSERAAASGNGASAPHAGTSAPHPGAPPGHARRGARPAAGGADASMREYREMRERWLAARERVVEIEARMARIEQEPSAAGTGHGTAAPADLDRPFAACTIVCRNYLAQARALLESLAAAEPTVRRYLLVLDAEPGTVDVDPGIEVVDPHALRVPDFPGMSFKYGVVEFNTAVKPYLLSLLFDEYGEEEVVYFDPDIVVQRRLDELRAMLAEADIVLTPHITRPIPDDGLTPTEPDIMISGAYNLGFIALRRTEQSRRFLAWWEGRLEDGCRIDVPNGLFTDQKWIDLVPGLFPGTQVLRDPTYNVAFWNLHERTIEPDADGYRVNGRPAGFFHISGFDPKRPDLLSKHQTRTKVEPDSGLARLLEDYAARLERHGWDATSGEAYGYDRFADGLAVHPFMRKLFLELPSEERRRFGDPFRELGPGGFRDWATRPRREAGGLSYFLLAIYEARLDLQDAFPDVRGRDRASFLEWARTQGPLEMRYDPSFARAPEADGNAGADDDANAAGDPRHYDALVDRIRSVAEASLPPGATVAVVSRGDYRLMHLGGRQVWHFPREDNGLYAGYHPRTSRDAIDHLESLRAAGADYLLFPATSAWWLDYYDEFRAHLDERYARLLDRPDVCIAFDLTGAGGMDDSKTRRVA